MNPFALSDRLSGVDRSLLTYMRGMRDQALAKHNAILEDACDRSLEMSEVYAYSRYDPSRRTHTRDSLWHNWSEEERRSRDAEFDRLCVQLEHWQRIYLQWIDKITLHCSVAFEHLGQLDAGKKLDRADTTGVLVGAIVDARSVDGAASEVAAQERLEPDTPKRLHASGDKGSTDGSERVHKRARK